MTGESPSPQDILSDIRRTSEILLTVREDAQDVMEIQANQETWDWFRDQIATIQTMIPTTSALNSMWGVPVLVRAYVPDGWLIAIHRDLTLTIFHKERT